MTIVTNRRDQPCGPESDRDDGEEDCNHIDRVPSIFEELSEAHFLEKCKRLVGQLQVFQRLPSEPPGC